MGYIRPDGTNVITSLMDPINKKEDKEKGTNKTAKKIFRTENNKKRKSNSIIRHCWYEIAGTSWILVCIHDSASHINIFLKKYSPS